ncbi:BglG family transcription antiterminator [Streptococcus ictaluri]|uniref:Phosphoenolpyruvate-dependent sugar PTS family porter, EIIA 2 n=1 Tax=Streptococcus ictaluri 707-05 TaxID=764299 RepID=G5K101_9STRE|nr:PTS sugar transporter subunit IIA [Streptococcus ictaluri]EHI70334.1 phosphoenolpyruvate-dependent sugar PTS family porter, EIIA 2 [Streptococcus ictaluri 707-05]
MNSRQKSLLRDLLNQNDYKRSKDYAELFSVSTKTVYKDIDHLNQFLEPFEIAIDRKPHLGIILIISDNDRQKLIQQLQGTDEQSESDFKMSVAYRELEVIRELGFGSGSIDPLAFALDHFVSEASIKRDLEKLADTAKDFQIVLERSAGKISLKGKESSIRTFLRQVISDRILKDHEEMSLAILERFFLTKDLTKILSSLTHYTEHYHFEISDVYKYYFIFDATIAFLRFKQGKLLNHIEDLTSESLQRYEVSFLADLYQLSPESLPQTEILATLSAMLAVGYIKNDSHFEPELVKQVQDLIAKVSQLTSIGLSDDKHLLKMLLVHIQPMLFRLKHQVLISNQMTEVIKTQYSVLYHLVWLATKELSAHYQVNLNATEISFLTIHFEVAIQRKLKPLTIYVICPHHLATSELIMSQLRKVLPLNECIQAVSKEDLNQIDLTDHDLIISSVDISEMGRPFIFVDSIITPAQLQEIQRYYSNFLQGNTQLLAQLADHKTYIESIINHLIDESIFLKKSFKSKRECLEYIISLSAFENQENPAYHNSIFKRERLGSTRVYTGIALPHANPEAVTKSQLIMMTLDKPIKWGMHYVKVIMLIAIAGNEVDWYREALISIYSKIDSTAYIEDLWEANDSKRFKEALFKEVYY